MAARLRKADCQYTSHFYVYADVGHAPFREDPDRFNQELTA